MSPERYFFCHLPKTGGMSTLVGLRRQFGEHAVYPLPEDRDNPIAALDVNHLRTVFEAKGHQIKVVAGHFPLCTIEQLGEPFRTFTVLREPVDRTLSHLRYQTETEPEYAKMSLSDAYGIPVNLFTVIHNMMVKMLGATAEEVPRGVLTWVECTEEHLARAKRALDQMTVVGLTSSFTDFIDTLERTNGWNLGDPVFINRTDPQPIEDGFAARIARDNPLDVQLYEYAQQLVAARAARHAPGPPDASLRTTREGADVASAHDEDVSVRDHPR